MAFTYDTKGRTAWSTSDPVTLAYTCGASAKLLVVTLTYAYNASGRTGGAPTYNGVALTQADQRREHSSSPETSVEIWYMLNPPTGSSYTISVPNSGTLSLEVVASSYNAASGYCAMLHTATGGNGASTNPSVTITPTLNNCVIVAVVGDGDNSFAPTARSGTSLYENNNGSSFGSGHQYFIQTTAAAKAMSWTESTSEDWGCCVAAFVEIPQGVDVSKATDYSVLSQPKGVSASKVNVYSVLIGGIQVAQVAEEIVYTTDVAIVQVAQVAEEIVYTTDVAIVQVAQVAQEIVLANYGDIQVAQYALETLVESSDAAIQVAQYALENLVAPSDTAIQAAQYAIEVLVQPDTDFVAQVATEVMIQPTSQQAQVAQVAHEVMVQPTSQQAQVAQVAYEVMITGYSQIWDAQSAFEVLVKPTSAEIQAAQSAFEILVAPTSAEIQVAQSAFEVLVRPELAPQVADVAQVATEIIAQNPPRATLAHTATEVLLQNLTRAHVAHTAVELITKNTNAARVSHTAIEIISPTGNRGIVAHTATEVLIKNMNWVRTAHVATEVPMPGPAGAPGDTLVTQMKLSVLQEGGGIVRGSQVTRATTIRADEDLMVSHVVRAVVIHRKRDFWPALLRMMGSD